MNRFASTRSDSRASQPGPPAQWRVGSIDEDGIRYGLTTHALIASTIAIAPTIVTIQSIAIRQGRGRPAVRRSIGLRDLRRGFSSRTGASGKVGGGATPPPAYRGGAKLDSPLLASYSARLAG